MGKMIDQFCDHCGYDLTGLDFQGRCPECGSYYDSSSGQGIRGNDLILSQRRGDWVVRLFQAMVLFFAAIVILLLGVLAAWKSGGYGAMIFTGIIAMIFIAYAVLLGFSLRRL